MSLLCKRCDNPVDDLDFGKATIIKKIRMVRGVC